LGGPSPVAAGPRAATPRHRRRLILRRAGREDRRDEQAATHVDDRSCALEHRPPPQGRTFSARYSSAVAAFNVLTASKYASRLSMNSRCPTNTSVILVSPIA